MQNNLLILIKKVRPELPKTKQNKRKTYQKDQI